MTGTGTRAGLATAGRTPTVVFACPASTPSLLIEHRFPNRFVGIGVPRLVSWFVFLVGLLPGGRLSFPDL